MILKKNARLGDQIGTFENMYSNMHLIISMPLFHLYHILNDPKRREGK
jgi:hypothetical protein